MDFIEPMNYENGWVKAGGSACRGGASTEWTESMKRRVTGSISIYDNPSTKYSVWLFINTHEMNEYMKVIIEMRTNKCIKDIL